MPVAQKAQKQSKLDWSAFKNEVTNVKHFVVCNVDYIFMFYVLYEFIIKLIMFSMLLFCIFYINFCMDLLCNVIVNANGWVQYVYKPVYFAINNNEKVIVFII